MALKHRIALIIWLLLAVASGVLLHGVNTWWGNLNQDEGWYLYAARATSQGMLPYADYAFTQGPLLPLVYAGFQPVVDRFGMLGARSATAILALLAGCFAILTASLTAKRGVTLVAAVLTAILILVNVYHSYFTTIVKTYALASVVLMGGLLATVGVTDRRRAAWALIAGLLLGLSAGVRFSLGIALPIVGLFFLFRRRVLGDRCWLLFGLGGAGALLAVFLPFVLHAPEGLKFGLLDYHGAREVGSPLQLLVYKMGFLSRFTQAYFVFTLLAVMGWVFRNRLPGSSPGGQNRGPFSWNSALWLVGIAISAVHFAAPFPYDDYQVVAYPVLATALAVSLANRLRSPAFPEEEAAGRPLSDMASTWSARLCAGVFLVAVFAAGGSPIVQDWVVIRRDRIWWQLKEESAVQRLRHAAALLRSRAAAGTTLLTQDAYLAVEGGFTLPRGFEMGPFSYFPDMENERASLLRVHNRASLRSLLASADAPVAAVSGYTFSIASPAIARVPESERAELLVLLGTRYQPFAELADFGQAHTGLNLYERVQNGP